MKKVINIHSMQEEIADGFFKKKVIYKLFYPTKIDLHGEELIFEYDVNDIEAIGDSAIFSLLPVAYWDNVDIEVNDAIVVSKSIQDNVDKICEVWNKFFDYRREVKINGGKKVDLEVNLTQRCGLLFSGGVDALATLIEKESEVDYLLYCYGGDGFNWDKFRKIERNLNELAEAAGKKMIYYSTNIKKLTTVSWGGILHGCGLIGPVLSLSSYIDKVIISASHSYDVTKKYPSGSSILTDKYMSNPKVSTEHYGVHLRRIDKIKKVSENQFFLDRCRVCYQNTLKYNCGVCEKCIRTMLLLLLMKVPHEKVSFPREFYSLDKILNNLRKMKIKQLAPLLLWSEILHALKNDEFDISKAEKEIIEGILLKRLGGFYQAYETRSDDSSFDRYFLKLSFIRKVERFFKLPPDSLGISNYYERKLRGAYYGVIDWIKQRGKK